MASFPKGLCVCGLCRLPAQPRWWEMVFLIEGCSVLPKGWIEIYFLAQKAFCRVSLNIPGQHRLLVPRFSWFVSALCDRNMAGNGKGFSFRSSWGQKRWCRSKYLSPGKSSSSSSFPISQIGF